MINLDLDGLGAAYYTGNCHKWLCAPRGTAFLHVRADRMASVRPLVISHGANARARRRSRFHLEHDWTGTRDPSAWLTLPAAITVMESMTEDGWPEVYSRNHDLAVRARAVLCELFGIEPPCPDRMIGSMAAIPLPDSADGAKVDAFSRDALQDDLYREWAIEVPVIPWPAPPRRLIRISAQLHNGMDQYRYLANALAELL
jgi:isopenicillin-N epimerase